MAKSSPIRLSDLRGLHQLASDATVGVTDLVEAMHRTILRTPGVLGEAPTGATGGITGFVYHSVRSVTRLVGGGVDALLERLGTLIGEGRSSPEREAMLATLNGVLGDYLEKSGNPLAIPMRFRVAGQPLDLSRDALLAAFPAPGRHLLVLVHGLCMNDLQWTRNGHDHGAALARDLGCTPVYLHYDSGRHIFANGRDFADRMEALLAAWPHPLERLTILGHSMGGLVARSACHYAARAGHAWVGRLDDLVFLGTPHLGASFERAGKWADLLMELSPYSAPFARLGRLRSAGIQDLGHADLCEEDWQSARGTSARALRPSLPLPAGVRCQALAASRQARQGKGRGKPRGDGLVAVASALGRHRDVKRDLGLPPEQCWIGYGMGHFDLLERREAYERIRRGLAAPRDAAAATAGATTPP